MSHPTESQAGYVRAASMADVEQAGCLVVHLGGRPVALFARDGRVFAVDNRCPHLGFPLHRGSVADGILTCHWHHARFDLATGGTFDLWADDLPVFPVEIRDGAVWLDPSPPAGTEERQRTRLRDGLERSIPLVIGKSVIGLVEGGSDPVEPFRLGVAHGVRNRRDGWGTGLTLHTCLMNLLPALDPADRPLALYHGLSAVARDCAGAALRLPVRPLPGRAPDPPTLGRWFRRFVASRDAEGAERCLATAVRSGLDRAAIADLLFTAATDIRFGDEGHLLDFTNKALEALDRTGWEDAENVLGSLAPLFADAERAEDSGAWRHPVDLVGLLDGAFEKLPGALAEGRRRTEMGAVTGDLSPLLLGDDPSAIVDGLLDALRNGVTAGALATAVAYASALRIARFPTTNEHGDWDTAHHTFTYTNAVRQAVGRASSPEIVRGIFDGALSVYLDRFLNVPPARLPEPDGTREDSDRLLLDLPVLFERRQPVAETATLIAEYLGSGGDPDRLIAALGHLLLREDRDFHAIQTLEAAARTEAALRGTPASAHVLIAAGRYLAAHAPTARAQGQTYLTALRLSRGDRIYEDA